MIGAATGVLFPIGLSYLLLYFGFGYGAWLMTTLFTTGVLTG